MRAVETTTYVGERSVLDADSHVMELGDFLDDFVDPAFKDRLRDVTSDRLAAVLTEAVAKAAARRTDAEAAKLAEDRLMQDKGWHAMGAFDPTERSRVLDLLGVEGQLVFATFATARFVGKDEDRLYAGSSAQNRAMAHFCSQDKRLLPVAFVPLVDPGRAIALAVEAIEAGCAAVMVPSTAAGTRGPTHPDLHGFWDVLSEANVPFVLHVGGGGRLLDPAFHNNGMPVPDHLGGGENVRSKDFLAIPHSPEVFLGTLIYDGLFDRFPKLRGGCIEQGAGWVVSWMRHLDYGIRAFRRTEEPLRRLELATFGLRPPAPQIHAVPRGTGGLDDGAVGCRALHVLDRLPAPGGWQGSVAEVRRCARWLRRRGSFEVLLRQHARTSPRGTHRLTLDGPTFSTCSAAAVIGSRDPFE